MKKLKEAKTAIETAKQPPIQGIAVLGSHPQTVELAPFDDPSWLIYACSPDNIRERTLPRVDQWFEVHLPVTHPTRPYEYLRRLEDNNVAQSPPHAAVIWARDPQFLARVKDARPYPEEEMRTTFCPFLFNSSIAFMLAKAIVDAEKHNIPAIGLWGILQASQVEYVRQRPSTQYFIWEAARRGIKMIAARESRLFELPPEDW